MGYAIICTLQDAAIRSVPPSRQAETVADGLRQMCSVAKNSTHADEEAIFGPWTQLAICHSNTTRAFTLAHHYAHRVSEDTQSDAWVAAISASTHATVARNWHRSRSTASSGIPTLDKLYGPDRMRGATILSAWWLYVDALQFGPDYTAVATTVVAAMDDRFFTGTTVGPYSSALNRAGALVAPGSVALEWAGNRLHCPLTP